MPRAAEIAVVVVAGWGVSAGVALGQATFHGLGALEAGEVSEASDVSADGSVVVGYAPINHPKFGHASRAFRWTSGTGMVSLDMLGFFGSSASGVSGDGLTVVGVSGGEGFRWVSPGPIEPVGLLPGATTAWARGASFDGSVVVGDSGDGTISHAFRAVGGGLPEPIGSLAGGDGSSSAADVSADGSVIVGSAGSTLGVEAFRWTAGGAMTGLGLLPGATAGDISRGTSVSADGSVVVGVGTLGVSNLAFRSVDGGTLELLGDVAGGDVYSAARGVNADGSIIVGESSDEDGLTGFIWTAGAGMVAFDDYLAGEFGLVVEGWTLTSVTGVSADGLVFVGSGINPAGLTEAWRVVVPAPGAVALLGVAGISAARRRRPIG